MPAEIRLVCLDLDGTALDADALHVWLNEDLVDLLNKLTDHGIQWCANSGRPHQNQLGIIQSCRRLTHMPVALLSGERYIHWLSPRYAPHEPFNQQMSTRLRQLYPLTKTALEPHREALRERYPMKHELEIDHVIGWQLASSTQVPDFVDKLAGYLETVPDAQVLRNGAWVIITHRAAGKGVILAEASHHLGRQRHQIVAVGDHHNDLDMLDGRVAATVGCPADADHEVLDCVRAAGGIVSRHAGARGTAEILRQVLGQRV